MKKIIPLILLFLIFLNFRIFGQQKNPEIVFDIGSSLFSSTNATFFSGDNKYLAIADIANVNPSIKIIDLGSGLPIKTIRGESNYYNLQFSNDFKYFRYNRLPMSDTDSNRFEAVQNTFTGEKIFKRKINDARGGPRTYLFGDFMVVEKKDSVYIKSLGKNNQALTAPSTLVMSTQDQLILRAAYGSSFVNIFDSKTNTMREIDFTKQRAALLTSAEKDEIAKNKYNTYSVKAYGITADEQYVVAIMESYSSDLELIKVFCLETDSVVFNREKPKIAYSDEMFYGAVQFDKKRGTITYASKEGLAVDNINKPNLFVIPYAKIENQKINCGFDSKTGYIINWCNSFVKIYDPQTGEIILDTDTSKAWPGNAKDKIKFTDIRQNPALPLLYIQKVMTSYYNDTTSVYNLQLNKIVKNARCKIISISANGKYIYGLENLRYCLFNEQLEVIKYLNDCSLVTTTIDEDNLNDGSNDHPLKTGVDYVCEVARLPSTQYDEKTFYWDIKKLERATKQPWDNVSAGKGKFIKRGFDIIISSQTENFHPVDLSPQNDTLVVSQKSTGFKTSIFFLKRLINAVDIDLERKQIFIITSPDYTNHELGVYSFDGKQKAHYKINLKDYVDAYFYQISLDNSNHFVFLTRPGSDVFKENQQLITAYNLLNGNLVTEIKADAGFFSISSTSAGLAFVRSHADVDTLFVKSLITGKQTQTRLKFNSFKNNLIVYFQPEDNWYKGSFLRYPENGKIIVEDWEKNLIMFEWPIKNDAIHDAIISPDNKLLAFPDRNGNITLIDLSAKKIIARFIGHIDQVRKLYFTKNNQYLLSSSDDGTLRYWNLKQNKENLRVINFGAEGYIMLTPDGYYRSSQAAIKRFGYVANYRVLDAGQLDIKYNRPDKVLQAIGSTDTALIHSYKKAYEKRIKKLGIDTISFKNGYSLPKSDFINRDEIELDQKKDQLTLHISGSDSTYTLDRFNVWVNQVPVYGIKGVSLKRRIKHSLDTTISITLSEGQNRIESSVTDVNGTESYHMPLIVNYTPVKLVDTTLYFIGIGINKFADKTYNLNWSVKDIRDLALKFKGKYGSKCLIDTLFDENVTTANVAALKNSLLKSGVNDKVVLAYSGHGLLSKDYDYFLSTYNVDFYDPAKNGLPYDALENLLDSIPARKKLMLIDACHSGELDKDEMNRYTQTAADRKKTGVTDEGHRGTHIDLVQKNGMSMASSFELMKQLFVNVGKSTGATVISAAGGVQYALEKNDLKNGVFTYSILENMQQNPHVNLSALKQYVNKRVIELTAGMQVPTTRNEIDVVDWQVW